jgi:hypothetical protein
MSARATNWAWDQHGMGTAAKVVLLSLAEYADREDGTCFPSRKTISEECEMSPATVTRALATLLELGLIQVDQRRRDNGSRTSNLYTLSVPTQGLNLQPARAQSEQAPYADCADQSAVSELEKTPLPLDPVEQVFDKWRWVMKHPGAQLDEKRRRKIAAALKVATLDECMAAIIGCSKSDYHMARGQYKGATKYDHLSLILRSREDIERFIGMAPQTAGGVVDTSGADVNIRQAMKSVLDAYDLAGSVEAQSTGDEAERFLVANGWTVVREPNTRPRFVRQ